jgi:hypothetical protein
MDKLLDNGHTMDARLQHLMTTLKVRKTYPLKVGALAGGTLREKEGNQQGAIRNV